MNHLPSVNKVFSLVIQCERQLNYSYGHPQVDMKLISSKTPDMIVQSLRLAILEIMVSGGIMQLGRKSYSATFVARWGILLIDAIGNMVSHLDSTKEGWNLL